MNNECYKSYTLQKTLDKIEIHETAKSESAKRTVRLLSTSRQSHGQQCTVYEVKCVICNHVKHQGTYEKFRICEFDRAKKFLEATVYMQDEVYVRTCDLQDVNSVFGADIYCHNTCIKVYLLKYDRCKINLSSPKQSVNAKQMAWSAVIPAIETGLLQGDGYELSYVRDCMNNELGSHLTNQEVKVLLVNHFDDKIAFSRPKQANKSSMFFSKSVTAECLAETIRTTDPIRQSAEIIRQCLQDMDFDLQDRFCDANDLDIAWTNMVIPEPLLKFFAVLFNFDMNAFTSSCKNVMQCRPKTEVTDDDDDDDDAGASLTKCRQVQALTQTLFHIVHRGRKRTPMHMMNSQAIYDTCKSKTLIKSFNRFGFCCSYDELLRHHNDMATYVVESSGDGMPFPSHFGTSQFTVGAFDNFDHDEATLSGIGGSHDTVSVLFQEDDGSVTRKPRISETMTQHGPRTFHCEMKCQELQPFHKPAKKGDLQLDYEVQADPHQVDEGLVNGIYAKDLTWSLARLDICESDSNSVNIKPGDQIMPDWSVANSVLSEHVVKQKRVAFLPVLPYPVTQYDTVYTAMKNFQEVLQYLKQSKLPVTCDEGVYHIAREIQLIRHDEFQDIILCMGTFHMAKVALGCLGKLLAGSGAETILVESGVFGANVVQSVITGKNYTRSLKGMQLLKEAMLRLEWAEFSNVKTASETTKKNWIY